MTDIVERLRGPRCCVECQEDNWAASAEIERLRAMNASLEEANFDLRAEIREAADEIERQRARVGELEEEDWRAGFGKTDDRHR